MNTTTMTTTMNNPVTSTKTKKSTTPSTTSTTSSNTSTTTEKEENLETSWETIKLRETKVPKGSEMPSMFYGIQQYFSQKALAWVLDNYDITPKDGLDEAPRDLSYFIATYNAAIKAQQFEPKTTKKTKKSPPKELTEEEKKEKELKRCPVAKNPNAKGIIEQCGMSKIKNPKENENPDLCSNHNRALQNGKEIVLFDPSIHGPAHPVKTKPSRKSKSKSKSTDDSDDEVTKLVNQINTESDSDESTSSHKELHEFVNKSKTPKSTSTSTTSTTSTTVSKPSKDVEVGCDFIYTRKTKDKNAGDRCGLVNCTFASHKKKHSQKIKIPSHDSTSDSESTSDSHDDTTTTETTTETDETTPDIIGTLEITLDDKTETAYVDKDNVVYTKHNNKYTDVGELGDDGEFESY